MEKLKKITFTGFSVGRYNSYSFLSRESTMKIADKINELVKAINKINKPVETTKGQPITKLDIKKELTNHFYNGHFIEVHSGDVDKIIDVIYSLYNIG